MKKTYRDSLSEEEIPMEWRLLADKVFDGSASLLFASLLSGKQLPPEEVKRMRTMINAME